MSNKILMIVNDFPPSGESGVQRPLKYLKYFARDNWETFVITPRQPVRNKNNDVTLEKEIPKYTKVFKTSSWGISEDNLTEVRSEYIETTNVLKKQIWKVVKFINDLLFPIDKQIGWFPFALITAIKVINKYKIRNIYITAFPYSAFLCGTILKKLYGKKLFWIADYRDAWQFSPLLNKLVLPFRYRFICRMDEKVLRTADYITFSSPYVLKRYQEKFSWLEGKSDFITNGYDEDDFTNLTPERFEKFTFVFMGKIPVSKGNPIPMLKVIRNQMKIDYQYFHLGLIGKGMIKQIEQEGLTFFHYLGYKSHSEALAYSAGANINIVLLNNDPDSIGVIPGKIFELIRLGKPILAVGPAESFIKEIILSTGSGVYACSDDMEQIANALEQQLSKGFQPPKDLQAIEQYSRQACSAKLAAIYLATR